MTVTDRQTDNHAWAPTPWGDGCENCEWVIAPTAKKLWGDALKSPHRNFVKCTVKLFCYHVSDSDLLRELTVPSQIKTSLLDLREVGRDKRRGKGKQEVMGHLMERGRGRRERTGGEEERMGGKTE